MRITNKMMTTNMQNNISRNKKNISTLGNQYSTGQKIQKPSEDPTVAVRSLKYRTQLTELDQYYEKNIPDAKSWMDVTESAMTSINEILTSMNTYCNQGTNDTLEVKDRNSIIETLKEYQEQIYQYGNTDYAGRYVFTGYRTDTPLLFKEDSSNLKYTISQEFTGKDIDAISYVYNETSYVATNTADDYAADAPTLNETHRIRLAYGKLDSAAGTAATAGPPPTPDTPGSFKGISFSTTTAGVTTETVVNEFGTTVTTTPPGTSTTDATHKVNIISSTNANAYTPAADCINFIPETGELVLSDQVYASMQKAEDIKVDYDKTKFFEGDVKPEHYFACKTVELDGTGTAIPATNISYSKPDTQDIQYEINFSQQLTVNTMACNSISLDIGRQVQEVIIAADEVTGTEAKIADAEKKLAEATTDTQKAALKELKEQLNTELALKKKVMQTKFGNTITMTTEQQNNINVALADHGSRYVRLELTESRLADQQVDFKDMLEKNDSVNIEDIIIDYNAAQTTYNASLSSAAKVVTNTLLDFL